ncbi:MAG: hypothetical protein K8R87_13870, partial [Verrucomicrobia bacterium]|nr:hypothetical protein [Verrucomicrobiota bacterium]
SIPVPGYTPPARLEYHVEEQKPDQQHVQSELASINEFRRKQQELDVRIRKHEQETEAAIAVLDWQENWRKQQIANQERAEEREAARREAAERAYQTQLLEKIQSDIESLEWQRRMRH